MCKTWCCANWTRLRFTSASLFTLVVMLFLSSSFAWAGTPDWLRQARQASLPTYPDDTDAIVLLDERSITVSPTGEVHTTYRKAYKILRPNGRSRGTLSVYFDTETQLAFMKAWSITSDNEEYEVKESDAIETAAYAEGLYADTRYKVLQIPASRPGSVIGYEYQQRQRPFVMQAIWSFQDDIPVRLARLALELPPNWSYTPYWRNSAVVKPLQSGENRWTWQLSNIEPIRSEPDMATWRSVAGEFELSFAPKKPTSGNQGLTSWSQIAQWYMQLTRERRDATPAIRDKVHELNAGANDSMEKIRRLGSYVQHSVRYVAIEIGIGGYQPHPASDVFSAGYGDCKDKATLLYAMLQEAGIDAYYVLINSNRDYLSPEFPSPLGFNHVILAVRLPQGSDVAGNYAVLHHPNLGALLFFDPTDDSTPMGYLPSSLQSNNGFLVTESGGEILTLPLAPPPANRILRLANLTIDKLGNMKGTIDEVRTGPSAAALRESLVNQASKSRQKIFQGLLSGLIDGAVLTGARLSSLKAFNGSLSISYDFSANTYAQRASNLFLFRTCVLGHKSRILLEGKPRIQPVVFPTTVLETDIVDISLPEDFSIDEVPQNVSYDYPFGSYKSEITTTEHNVHYARTYEIKDVRVTSTTLESLKRFFREIADDEQSYVIMKSKETAYSSALTSR